MKRYINRIEKDNRIVCRINIIDTMSFIRVLEPLSEYVVPYELFQVSRCNREINESVKEMRHHWRKYCAWLSTLLNVELATPNYANYANLVRLNDETVRAAVEKYLNRPEEIELLLGSITHWDVSSVTDMRYLFADAISFNEKLQWKTSNVTDMRHLFYGATSFDQDLPWDVSSVTNMTGLFGEATSFNKELPWDVSSVTDMSATFLGAHSFNKELPWDVSSATDLSYMFYEATSFNQELNWNIPPTTVRIRMFTNYDLISSDT